MIFHQKNLLWDEGVMSGPLFYRLYFFSNLAGWNKQSPSPVALQARNLLVSSSQNNVLCSKRLANLILVDHFWIFDCLLDCICWREIYNSFVFLAETLVNSNWNSTNRVIRSSEKIDSYTTTNTIFSHTLCFPAQMEQTAVMGYAG